VKQLTAAAPDTAVFVYYRSRRKSFAASATKEWIDKIKASSIWAGMSCREQIFANQKRLAVSPANAELNTLAA